LPKEGSDVGGLFSGHFAGFGDNPFQVSPDPLPLHQINGRRPGALRARVREQCPKRPGIYGMIDGDGRLIYVGKAKCLRSRLLSYFRPRGREPKAGRIVQQSRSIVWEHAPSEFAALLRELQLIGAWRPRLNVHGQPGRWRRTYVCLGRQPAPHAFLARRPPARVLGFFGPIPGGRRAHDTVRSLNDWFQLRDCPQPQTMLFADHNELFPSERAAGCLRYEIGTCLGPCAGACSERAYADRVRAARAFLAGNDTARLQKLKWDMTAASEALAFERAALLRDRLERMLWLWNQLRFVRLARERHSFVYPVAGYDHTTVWYLINGGCVRTAVAAPVDIQSRRLAAAAINRVYGGECGRAGRELTTASAEAGAEREYEIIEEVLLVSAWFRRHPGELEATLSPQEALLQVREQRRSRLAQSLTSTKPVAFGRSQSTG
jgi:excinuclease ABC subunit C